MLAIRANVRFGRPRGRPILILLAGRPPFLSEGLKAFKNQKNTSRLILWFPVNCDDVEWTEFQQGSELRNYSLYEHVKHINSS
jgi:hypothetical protein